MCALRHYIDRCMIKEPNSDYKFLKTFPKDIWKKFKRRAHVRSLSPQDTRVFDEIVFLWLELDFAVSTSLKLIKILNSEDVEILCKTESTISHFENVKILCKKPKKQHKAGGRGSVNHHPRLIRYLTQSMIRAKYSQRTMLPYWCISQMFCKAQEVGVW